MNELILVLESAEHIPVLEVEAKADDRITVETSREPPIVHIKAADISGLRAAMNTTLRVLMTAEGVKEALKEDE